VVKPKKRGCLEGVNIPEETTFLREENRKQKASQNGSQSAHRSRHSAVKKTPRGEKERKEILKRKETILPGKRCSTAARRGWKGEKQKFCLVKIGTTFVLAKQR